MPCPFPWMTFWTAAAAIGTIMVAILAIWGDWFRAKWAAPRLKIVPHNLRGDLTGTAFIFYHLRVINMRRWVTAKNCSVLLVDVNRRGPDGQFRAVPFPFPLPFYWTPAGFSPILETITSERVFDFGLLSRDEATGFKPSIIQIPDNFQGLVGKGQVVRYSLQIMADNYVPSVQVFEVAWNGVWTDKLDEMANNLTISERP